MANRSFRLLRNSTMQLSPIPKQVIPVAAIVAEINRYEGFFKNGEWCDMKVGELISPFTGIVNGTSMKGPCGKAVFIRRYIKKLAKSNTVSLVL